MCVCTVQYYVLWHAPLVLGIWSIWLAGGEAPAYSICNVRQKKGGQVRKGSFVMGVLQGDISVCGRRKDSLLVHYYSIS